jgi:hypothetical protein
MAAADALQREIERIAKLRGVSPTNYTVQVREHDARYRRLSAAEVRSVFSIPANPVAEDFRVFDRLPARSRFALRNLRLQTYSPRYYQLLERIMDEEALIEAVRAEEADLIRSRCLDRYGPDHPGSR